MTLREIIDKETLKTLYEIEQNVAFIRDCRFLVIKINEEKHGSISTALENLGLEIEGGYSKKCRGYIWLRWNFQKNNFETYLNYETDGESYNAPLYDSSDITTIGEFLTIFHKNETKDSKKD
jgi:hypothetical protein